MLLITSLVRERIVSQRRSITFSRVGKISFLKPLLRISFQICSIGFISGVYGGIKKRNMFSGTCSAFALCQAAPSQQSKITSSGYFLDNSRRNAFMHTVSQCEITRKKESPVNGSTVPEYDGTEQMAGFLFRTSNTWAC